MRLIRMSVEGLHGLIDASIEFFQDLTIIVGRNGSGKTSLLTLISDLLRLDVEALRATRVKSAILELHDANLGAVTLQLRTNKGVSELAITIGSTLSATFPLVQAVVPHLRIGEVYPSPPNLELVPDSPWTSGTPGMLIQYGPGGEGPVYFRYDEWNRASLAVKERTRLTFVKLDRTIVAIDPEGTEAVDPGVDTRRRGRPSRDPLDKVIRVTNKQYVEYRSAVEEIKDAALRELLGLLFRQINPELAGFAPNEKQLRAQLMELQKRVERSQIISDAPELRDAIHQFFEEFGELLDQAFKKDAKRMGRRTLREESVELILNFRRRQIEDLLRIFEAEQNKTAEAYAAIRHYLMVAGKFLNETGKRLGFSATYELAFTIPSLQKKLIAERPEYRSIKELSSGEKQILIILTYLAFSAGDSIFVIDEPELSLHVTWQRYLTEGLMELRPTDSQIILATHAPEIAGRAPNNCVILRPDYFGDSAASDG